MKKIIGYGDFIKSYKQGELAEKEGKSGPTIKNSYKYIEVGFTNSTAKCKFNRGDQAIPYSIRYISLDELSDFLKKNYHKELFIIDTK